MNTVAMTTERKPSVLRRVVKITLSLAGVLLVGFLVLLAIAYKQMHDDPQYGSIEELIEQAKHQGGRLIECKQTVCRDAETQSYEGFAEKDGYYIVFPQDRITKEDLERKRQEVERLSK